jgi:hypothetical protein
LIHYYVNMEYSEVISVQLDHERQGTPLGQRRGREVLRYSQKELGDPVCRRGT